MSEQLTPTEVARRCGLQRREVITECMKRGIPIFNGRIDIATFVETVSDGMVRVSPTPPTGETPPDGSP